jgi:hypothetical protein
VAKYRLTPQTSPAGDGLAGATACDYKFDQHGNSAGQGVTTMDALSAGRSAVVAASIAAFAIAASAMAQSTDFGLSEAQVNRALEIEAAERSQPRLMVRGDRGVALPGLAQTPVGKAGKSVRPLVSPVETMRPDAGSGRAARTDGNVARQLAVVTRYDYATGVTTRTTVDLGTGTVLRVREDTNYPTPLGLGEFEHALAIARRSVPKFDAIIKGASPAELVIRHMTTINDNPSSSRYGHRLVYLWIERPTRTDRVLVDLSADRIVADH